MRKSVIGISLSLLVIAIAGCGGSPGGNVAAEMDQQTIQDYQAQAEGDNYKNYVEPK